MTPDSRPGRRPRIVSMRAVDPAVPPPDRDLIARIAQRTGATPTIVLAVLLAAVEETE